MHKKPPPQPPGSGGQQQPPPDKSPDNEPVWTYRGYQIRTGEFNTAMVHLYRAEIARSNAWRQRLDATTNWAVLTTGAAISVAFSDGLANHMVIILSSLLITLFLFLEARRYRYYELWSYRTRLLETDFYAGMLVPPFGPSSDWAESLAESLLQPSFPISVWEALGRRFRRNYVWIYMLLDTAWILKIWLHPSPAASLADFVQRASVGDLPGWLVLSAGLVFNGVLFLLGMLTLGMREASGEVLPRYEDFLLPGSLAGSANGSVVEPARSWQSWFRPSRHRQELIVYIITDVAKAVSARILAEMQRGVTALSGTGMYTGQARTMLMCVLTVTEMAHLKSLVKAEDPKAMIIVSPAQEVVGRGFASLSSE